MENTAPEAQYLRLNTEQNALDYLERAAIFIKETVGDIKTWKWVMIALHGALYGFAIAASAGTNPSNSVMTKRDKLIGFWDALKLCQDPDHMNMLIHSKPLILSESQKESIRFMKNHLRNGFEHFTPKLWAIEIHDMPQIAIDVLEVIRFLALETNTYIHLADEEYNLVDSLVHQSIAFIRETALYKEMKLAEELYAQNS